MSQKSLPAQARRAAHDKARELEAAAVHIDEVAANVANKYGPKDLPRAEKAYSKVRDSAAAVGMGRSHHSAPCMSFSFPPLKTRRLCRR